MKKFFTFSLACLFAFTIFTSTNIQTEAAPLLKTGSTGQDVSNIQAKLFRMGYLNTSPRAIMVH